MYRSLKLRLQGEMWYLLDRIQTGESYYELINNGCFLALKWHSTLECIHNAQEINLRLTYCGYIKLSDSNAGLILCKKRYDIKQICWTHQNKTDVSFIYLF